MYAYLLAAMPPIRIHLPPNSKDAIECIIIIIQITRFFLAFVAHFW